MPVSEGNQPEVLHSLETAAHEVFLRSLYFCGTEAKRLDNAAFLQCIKASGVNFSYTYDQFYNYKLRKQQAISTGHID